MKIFASGSCKLVTTINNGREKIEPIHSMFNNFVGINFLGKLHNTKQHIQFIKWINNEINLPLTILQSFLTSYSNLHGIENKNMIVSKKDKIKAAFYDCDYYIFEICSLKIYVKDNYQVQYELTNNFNQILQTETDLYNDLKIIREMIPNKKIIFQTHFRPNIIYNDPSKIIHKREIIYNVVKDFCNKNEKSYLYDPSILLNKDHTLFDGDTHFNDKGHIASFNYIYDNFINNV